MMPFFLHGDIFTAARHGTFQDIFRRQVGKTFVSFLAGRREIQRQFRV